MPCAIFTRRCGSTSLPNVLLEYRVHAEQVSSLHGREQARTAEVIIARQFAKLGMDSTPEKLALHRRLVSEVHSLSIQERLAARAWLDVLERQNAAAGRYVPEMFERLVAHFRLASGDQRRGSRLALPSSLDYTKPTRSSDDVRAPTGARLAADLLARLWSSRSAPLHSERLHPMASSPMTSAFRVVVLIAAYNEGDIIVAGERPSELGDASQARLASRGVLARH